MNLRRLFGSIPGFAGIALIYLSFHYSGTNLTVKDLMFTGGFLLVITSSTITPSSWASVTRQGYSSLTLNYGGMWFRFIAALMDFLFVGVAILFGARVIIDIVRLAGWATPPQAFAEMGTLYLAILLAGYWFYFAAMESSPWEATIGKIALRLRVTDINGARISFYRASIRYFVKIVSLGTFLIGFLVGIFTRRKQTLHDRIAKTLVVDA